MLSKSKSVGLVAAVLLLVVLLLVISPVIAPAVSVLRLLMLWDTLLKSSCIYAGGEKRECAGNSDEDAAKGEGLFVKAFRKYSFGGDAFNAIKGASRLATLFLVVGIGVLGLWGELTPKVVRFCKYCNMPSVIY